MPDERLREALTRANDDLILIADYSSHLPGGYRTPHVPTSVALRAVDDARAEERKRIIDLLRDGAMRREIRSNRPGNAAATTLMASWEALRLAADVIERSAGSAGSDGEDR